MISQRHTRVAFFALLALLATLLVACGDDEDSSETPPQASSPAQTQKSEADANSDGAAKQGNETDADSSGAPESEGNASFRVPGGDNSVQEYGEEGSDPERDLVAATAQSYMDARADGDWEKACAYLADSTVEPLRDLASQGAQQKSQDCPEIFEALTKGSSASDRASTIETEVGSFRFEGDRGFALFHGTDGMDYVLPFVKEDGEWKVAAIAESPLPGS